jgi:hypothetical protein
MMKPCDKKYDIKSNLFLRTALSRANVICQKGCALGRSGTGFGEIFHSSKRRIAAGRSPSSMAASRDASVFIRELEAAHSLGGPRLDSMFGKGLNADSFS